MDEFLNREDALELIIYFGGGAWMIIALLVAYFKTKKEFGSFKILKFFGFTFDYTIGFALIIVEAFTGNKNGGGSSAGGNGRAITKVQFRGGFANVSINNGKSTYSIKCDELVNWTAQSVTVKINNGVSTVVETRDPDNKISDSYFE